MTETAITTFVDGKSREWLLAGELSRSSYEAVSPAQQLVLNRVGKDGYIVIRTPASICEVLNEYILKKVHEITRKRLDDIGLYHAIIDESEHLKIIEILRETRFGDFDETASGWVAEISDQTGLRLNPYITRLQRDHIQIRTVRPGLTDFNPPHKDAYLAIWHDVINIWIPLNYLGHEAIMPLCPGSHLWAEEDILRTAARGAQVGKYKYNVPAVVSYQGKPLRMIRPALGPQDCLAFTPCLVHGFGVNETQHTRFALEFRLEVIP